MLGATTSIDDVAQQVLIFCRSPSVIEQTVVIDGAFTSTDVSFGSREQPNLHDTKVIKTLEFRLCSQTRSLGRFIWDARCRLIFSFQEKPVAESVDE